MPCRADKSQRYKLYDETSKRTTVIYSRWFSPAKRRRNFPWQRTYIGNDAQNTSIVANSTSHVARRVCLAARRSLHVEGRVALVSYPTSNILCWMLHFFPKQITYFTAHITHVKRHVTRHTVLITHQTSHSKPHTTHVTRLMSYVNMLLELIACDMAHSKRLYGTRHT